MDTIWLFSVGVVCVVWGIKWGILLGDALGVLSYMVGVMVFVFGVGSLFL